MINHRKLPGAFFSACLLAIVSMNTTAGAQTSRCDALTPDQQQIKQAVLASLHPYTGCDETFDRCLRKKTIHPLVLRLTNDICRQVKLGKSRQDIQRSLAKRAQSMLPPVKPASFALDNNTMAGDAKAPVRVVVYACARCPFCKVLVPALYKEVTKGSLKGMVKLYFRPFPLRDHPGSIEGGLAMVSAAHLGKFWPFVLKMYERYDNFCPKLLPQWAAETGLEQAVFEREVANLKNREALVAAKQEGIRNKVDATPTLFIDGRKYVYEYKLDIVIDVLQEAYESAKMSRQKTP